jgi:phosphoribosylformylglycinamidine (FGAM) synthase PurS component
MTVTRQRHRVSFRAALSAAFFLVSFGSALTPALTRRDVVRCVGSASVSGDSEFLVDTSIVRIPALNGQTLPAVAFDGANFLVVWQDDRNGVITGVRVTPEGAVLDPAGITITPTPGDRGSPDVGFDGANFLVVWEEDRSGTDWDIMGARMTPGGVVIDTEGFPISAATDDQLTPALAFDGTDYFVTWEDDRDDTLYNIYGARVTPQGEVLDSAGIPVSTAEDDQLTPAVAFDGAGFFVAWEDYRTGVSDIYGTRVTAQGAVLDPAGIPISTATNVQLLPSLAFDGTNLLVTWADYRSQASFDIYGTWVTSDGSVTEPDGFVIAQAADDQSFPAAFFDGQDFLVSWGDHRNGADFDIYGARVTPEGAVLDPGGFVIATATHDQYLPAVGYGGTDFLLAWEDDRSGSGYDIYGARVTPEALVLDSADILLSRSANDQNSPAACSNGEGFLVVWEDDRQGSGWDIYGARVTSAGEVLDPGGFVISQAAGDQRAPAVGLNGDGFLVVWEDYRRDPRGDIYGARVTPEGEVLDTSGVVISPAANDQNLPAVASDGENSLVVWADFRDSVRFHIHAARVTPDGAVLDSSGITVTTVPGVQYAPAVVFGGTNYLVAWQDTRSGSDWDIYGARISPQGEVIDPTGIAISKAGNNQRFPAAAAGGADFLVTWQDNRYAEDYDVFAARATPAGEVLDPEGIPVSTAAGDQLLPALGFDGTNWLVVWEDYRNDIDYDVYGARLSPEGTVFDSGAVVSRAQDQTLPRLGVADGGRILLVYQGWAGNVGGSDYNSNRIWGKLNPRPSNRHAVTANESLPSRGVTVVRRTLLLPPHLFSAPAALFSLDGRKVLELLPGANNVTRLSAGVYFMRQGLETKDHQALVTVRKVILTR